MGCDIHFHAEIKVNGEWLNYSSPHIPRWYKLFEKMAGVRGKIDKAISEPKGLPDNISKVVELDFKVWKGDAHSESWLNAKEITKLIEWAEEELGNKSYKVNMEYFGYLFRTSWEGFEKYPDSMPDFLEDIRFVFWFDN